MQLIFITIEALIILLIPYFLIKLQERIPVLGKLGSVALCYICGFVFSLMPELYDKTIAGDISSAAVMLALPLILMSLRLSGILKLSRPFILGFMAQIVSAVFVSAAACFIGNRTGISYAPVLAAMGVGLYTGGTPNLIAAGKALLAAEAAPEVIAAANTADIIAGGIYFLLLVTIMPPVYRKILVRGQDKVKNEAVLTEGEKLNSLPENKKEWFKLTGCLLLSVLVLAAGMAAELLVNGNLSGSMYIVITVSAAGLGLSFFRPVRRVKGTYRLGEYLVLVFSLGLSMSIDWKLLIADILPYFLFFFLMQTAVAAVHFILCKILRVSAEAAFITCAAGIYGPPFISPAAVSYGDRSLIAPGIVCSVFGLAVGSFLGIGMGKLLM